MSTITEEYPKEGEPDFIAGAGLPPAKMETGQESAPVGKRVTGHGALRLTKAAQPPAESGWTGSDGSPGTEMTG